jgi:hypothetical protein
MRVIIVFLCENGDDALADETDHRVSVVIEDDCLLQV